MDSDRWDEVEQQEFLADPHYPVGGVTVADGQTGAKKTWLYLSEAWELSKGRSIRDNCEPKKACRSLYFHGDLPMTAFKERMFSLGITSKPETNLKGGMFHAVHRDMLDEVFVGMGVDRDQFSLDKDFGHDSKSGKATLGSLYRQAFERMIKIHKPNLVVIDALFAFTCKNVSHPQTSRDLIHYFKRLAVKFKVSILVIVNHNKGASKNKMDDISAGAIFNNAAPIRESVRLKNSDGQENEWSYVFRFKDNLSPSTDDDALNFKFKLVDKVVDEIKRIKTAVYTTSKGGKTIRLKKKFQVKKIVYNSNFDWPEFDAEKANRSAQIKEAILRVLTDNPDGFVGAKLFEKVREIIHCSKPTYTACKKDLVREGVVTERETGSKNAKQLKLRKGKT